jgi:cyclophilin family peptidyl-prolyl cis-trans isomerase
MNRLIIFLLTASLLVMAGCAAQKSKSSKPIIKTGVTPQADSEAAVIEFENSGAYGSVKIELYSNIAPEMVKRFKVLAAQGFYDGTTIHRINDSVIQGGDPNSKDADPSNDGMGQSSLPDLRAEFSDIPYDRGIVGAARSTDVNSANSQFFITMKRVPGWDRNYTVFGKVVEGISNAATIQGAPTDRDGGNPERPLDDIRIKTIRIVPR